MKAAQIDNYGDVSAIEVREAETPQPSDNQVLVEVAAASLNPFDLAVLAGHAQSMAPLNFPATLGLDIAGTVVEVGNDVADFKPGDHVYGTANAMFGGSGAFAEFATANAGSVALSPKNVTDGEAASFPTAGISAWQSMVKELGVKEGQKVFINGGSGGVGSFAIQIAKHLGAYVVVTASAENTQFVKDLGADEVIDYKTQKFTDLIRDFDAALNTVRGENADDVLLVVKKGGVVASLTGQLDPQKAREREVTSIGVMAKVSTESLTELAQLIEKGAVHTVIDRTTPLGEIQSAYTALASESIRGKIIIDIK
jgi:alcohol dehydrogenase